MPRDLCAFLHDINDAIEKIDVRISHKSYEEFASDESLRFQIERLLEIVGEALRQASRLEPTLLNNIGAVKEAIAQRNYIIHAYFDIEPEIIWETAVHDLPELQREVSKELQRRSG